MVLNCDQTLATQLAAQKSLFLHCLSRLYVSLVSMSLDLSLAIYLSSLPLPKPTADGSLKMPLSTHNRTQFLILLVN